MNKEDADNLINNLIMLYNGQMNLGTFSEILISNYKDSNGNSYFHFLTEYSFEEFCIRNLKLNKNKKYTYDQYKELKSEYINQIKSFIKTLYGLKCELLYVNNNNQSPLNFSLNNNNYILSKEYLKILQSLGIYTKEDYSNFFETILKNGNLFDEDCSDLINFIFPNLGGFNNNIIDNDNEKFTTLLISLCKNFGENIYKKYNEIVKMEILENNDNDNYNIILNQEEINTQNIKKKSFEKLNDCINKNFFLIFGKLRALGAEIQNKKESGFIYLMSYPFFASNLDNFVSQNKIDINFIDESGNTCLNNLLNNQEYISQISKDIYNNTFKYLLANINKDILNKNNNNLKTIFYSCLISENFEEAKIIYNKLDKSFYSYYNSIILNYILEQKDPNKIIQILNIFKDAIDFNLFNLEQKKTLAHYICLYLSDDSHINIFTQIFSFIANLKIDFSLKDQYDRNCLFYLFLDIDDKKKMVDPFQQLTIIFQICKFNNLNDKDIFGNDLIFYAVQSNASKSIDILLNNGMILLYDQGNNENSIFSVCLLNKNFQLFNYLYEKIKDPIVFNHKIFEPYNNDINFNADVKMELDDDKKNETLYDFLNKNDFDKSDINMNNNIINNPMNPNFKLRRINNIFNLRSNNNNTTNSLFGNNNNNLNNNNINNNFNLFNNNNNNLNNNNINNNIFNNNNNINNGLDDLSPEELAFINSSVDQPSNNVINNNNKSNNDFNYFNFLDEEQLKKINDNSNNNLIKINAKDNNKMSFKPNSIINNFNRNNDEYILDRINSHRNIISDNIFRYCLSNNYEELCIFMINQKANLITICNELILNKRYKDLYDCIEKILTDNNNDQQKLVNLVDNKGQTIYHLIPFVFNNIQICKLLEKHNISNIYDLEGNTPMFNACKNFDQNFIHTFAHYSFDSNENQSNIVNYYLFFETKSKKTPLEVLYEQLDKNDNNILKLIIDISINRRKVYFIPLVKYLIENYVPEHTYLFKLDYKTNLNYNEYIRKVIGLYVFYTKELKESIMIKDELGNDPFILCVQKNNFDFLFNILLEEHNINLNSTNNKGKSVIHLIIEMQENKKMKKDILIKAINSGFDFNIKDNDGLLPIDYAYIEGDDDLVNVINEYYLNYGIKIQENNIIKMKRKFDYNKDSDTFYNESILVSMNIDKSENLNGLVSSDFKYDPLTSFYQVCLDKDNIPFSVNLMKKDYQNLAQGNEMKFCLQVIKDVNNDNEYLTIAVDNTQLSQYKFNDFESAKQKFRDLFKQLTANDWDNVKLNKLNFKTDYKKYYIFDYSDEEENAIYDYLKITIKNLYIKKKSEYKGDPKIKDLIYYILVKSYQNKFSIDENTKNVEQNTKSIIQKYKSKAIAQAITILFELKKTLTSSNRNVIFVKKKINYLINSYNDLIPFSKQSTDLTKFYNSSFIDDEISRLTNYYYIENVLKILLGAIYNLNNYHPLDYIIKSLGCEIEVLKKPNNLNLNQLRTEEDYIYNFINSTGGSSARITAVYKITKSVNDRNFNLKNFDNRYIFFHGTKVENVIGILSQGIKIAPVQAIYTGASYGVGIYLSDSFSVSLGYCTSNANNFNMNRFTNKRFMFMAEVAVGKVGYNDDTNISGMGMSFNDYYTTNEGYRIFKTHNNSYYGVGPNNLNYGIGGGVIVAHEETNVRIKYLIEID